MMSVFQAVVNVTFRLLCDESATFRGIVKSIPDGKEQRLQTKGKKLNFKFRTI